MKTWCNPAIETINLGATANGNALSKQFDEIRVDGSFGTWQNQSSGSTTSPGTTGDVFVM